MSCDLGILFILQLFILQNLSEYTSLLLVPYDLDYWLISEQTSLLLGHVGWAAPLLTILEILILPDITFDYYKSKVQLFL